MPVAFDTETTMENNEYEVSRSRHASILYRFKAHAYCSFDRYTLDHFPLWFSSRYNSMVSILRLSGDTEAAFTKGHTGNHMFP
jgi:hypothetical protein